MFFFYINVHPIFPPSKNAHLDERVSLISEESQGRFSVRGVAQFKPTTSGQKLGAGDHADWILTNISYKLTRLKRSLQLTHNL